MNKRIMIARVLIVACVYPTISFARYKSQPLSKISVHSSTINSHKDEFISFHYKILDAKACKKYFNTTSILKKGYQPIQIMFINNSAHNILISPNNFSFECSNPQDVANCLHRDGMSRGIGFGIASLWFLPLIFPALIQGLGATEYNNAMDIDFQTKCLKHQIIAPFSSINQVIFVRHEEFSTAFTCKVKNIDQNIVFKLYPGQSRFIS